MKTGLFDTAPSKDFLNLYKNDKPQCDRIASILNFNKRDISEAIGIPTNSVRFDNRMPTILLERIKAWATLLNLVAGHFDGDSVKTMEWFTTLNPLLGDLSPRDMIKLGRYDKLLKFVLNALAEHTP